MDRFEGLRRTGVVAVGLADSVDGDETRCQFDETTGWPQYSVNQGTADLPDSVCQILKTELRGISPRQLLALYEHVKRRCVAEGWKRQRDGTTLTPETVTLYDLNTYVIMPSTEARRHECQFDESGAERRERMTRSEVREGEEITCTQCAAKLKKTTDRLVAYWQCHQQCGGKHRWCGACACCSFVELMAGVGTQSVRRCPDGACGHAPMARSKVYPDKFGNAEEIACTGCAAKLELNATYWLCHRCRGGTHKLCSKCAPEATPVACAELQKPLWFVSHWWGEPIEQFISCLLQHARDRYYLTADDDSWLDIKYWVCAYANNQHAYAPRWADVAAGTRALENALHRIRAAYACMQAQRGRDDRPRAFGVREGDGRVDWHALSPGHERRCLHAHLVCEQLPTPTLALPRPSCAQLRCWAQPGGHPLSRMHARRIRATLGARSPRFLRSLAYDHNDACTCAASRSLLHRIPGVDRRVAEPHGR
jgi:hypothetical protein